MSLFALVVLGGLFGWLLCTFVLLSGRSRILDVPWFVFDSEWNPPSPSEIAEALAHQQALLDGQSPTSKRRLASVQFWFGLTVFLGAALLVLVEMLQDFRSAQAASIEDVVTEPRVATLVMAAALGFAARLYRRQLLVGIDTLSKIALVGGNAAKRKADKDGDAADAGNGNTAINYVDARFPWYVEVGLLLSLLLVAVFWINPQLLKNLTSFKAGGVEAHFATATGNATVQSGLIVQVDPARKTIANNWAAFQYPDNKDARYNTYVKDNEKHISTETKDKMDISGRLFDRFIKPIFVYRTNLYTNGSPINTKTNEALKRYAAALSGTVRDAGKNTPYHLDELNESLAQICPENH